MKILITKSSSTELCKIYDSGTKSISFIEIGSTEAFAGGFTPACHFIAKKTTPQLLSGESFIIEQFRAATFVNLLSKIHCILNAKLLDYNLGQKVGDKLTKLSKVGFLWNVLQLIFCNFLPKKKSKFGF